MTYSIKKAAVLGSGTMGGGIAAVLAGIGVDVILMDMPAKDTQAGDKKRNSIIEGNLKTLTKMRPAQLFSNDDMSRISIGNFEDDLDKLADRDWVIEVIVENLAIKKSLMARVAEHIGDHTIVTTNTSGLPIHDIAQDLDDNFTRRFLGTHFFNPPRYLHLLEIIPHSNTDPELVDFMVEFGTTKLGKGVVIAKDTPNFIGNRFMSMTGSQAMNYAMDHGYTVEEVDAITGPLIGRPKTATFNLNDLVGYDIAVHVARNLYDAIPDDPQREVLNHPNVGKLAEFMMENKMLGRKTDGGFYKMKRNGGNKELWALNLETREYEAPTKVRFDSVGEHRNKPLPERLKALIMEADDRAGEYLFHHHAFYLSYASHRVPEITDTIVNVDNAQKWGFNHEMGPFEIWDAIGVAESVAKFEAAGYDVAPWVKSMLEKGHSTFYQSNDKGQTVAYYDPETGDYVALETDPRLIKIADLKAQDKTVFSNGHGNIYDMGDGVLLWEFTTKGNTITSGFVEAGNQAIDLLENGDYVALVVGNESNDYCFGANLQDIMQSGSDNPMALVEEAIAELQALTLRMKYSSKPVIAAPAGRALGGGAELIMAANAVVVHMESYIGLVEVGVGFIPAGGGCKELVRRNVNPVVARGSDPHPPLRKVFETIATATVSESAKQAKEIGFLDADDKIVMNRSLLLGEAKAFALAYAQTYQSQSEESVYAAGRDQYAGLMLGVAGFVESGFASEHDALIAKKVATVLTGGAIAEPTYLPQQVFLNLEKQAFMELAMTPKTMERVMHMLTTGKPLRN
ncbi:MAG: 3-hydroxyacyl-CoA dehydrogenase NAD-binding domain-containing protein [Phototrophicaceae bacterium]